jgi:hypothetical protein
MEGDAVEACGGRHERSRRRTAHRWGKTKGKIGFHGGKVEIEPPQLRGFDGKAQALPSDLIQKFLSSTGMYFECPSAESCD